jgi:hypothetical protein
MNQGRTTGARLEEPFSWYDREGARASAVCVPVQNIWRNVCGDRNGVGPHKRSSGHALSVADRAACLVFFGTGGATVLNPALLLRWFGCKRGARSLVARTATRYSYRASLDGSDELNRYGFWLANFAVRAGFRPSTECGKTFAKPHVGRDRRCRTAGPALAAASSSGAERSRTGLDGLSRLLCYPASRGFTDAR